MKGENLMFNLKWAFKNLVANKRRSLGITGFIAAILIIMIINLLFIDGANTQMRAALRNNKGDLYFWSDQNMDLASRYLERHYHDKIEHKIKFLCPYDGTPNAPVYGRIYSSSEYAEGWIVGTEPAYLKYLDLNVSWPVKYRANLAEGTAVLEDGLAQKLNVKRGDYISFKVKNEKGMINTLQVMVDGIFVGSNLIFGDIVYINLKDQNLLWLTGKDADYNEMRLYFRPGVTDQDLKTIQGHIMRNYYDLYITSPRIFPFRESAFIIFKYFRYLLIFLFSLLDVVFVIILYFAIQNIFFMAFRRRRAELATLLTYGMKPFRIQLISLWEANLLFAGAFILAIPFSILITQLVHKFQITDSNLAVLITVIGGPRINFSINWIIIPALIIVLWAITLISAYKGAHSYLTMEIREITSKV
jgi:ABC-type lipoprotein release transport system permease subunit